MQCLHRSRLFSASHPMEPERGWGKDTTRRAEPHWPKGYSTPLDIMLGIWIRGRKRKWGTFGEMALVFQVTITCNGVLVCWRGIDTCLPMGSSKLIPWFSFLVRVSFALPFSLNFCCTFYTVFISTHAFSFLLWFSPLSHQKVRRKEEKWEEQNEPVVVWSLVTGIKPFKLFFFLTKT